MDKLLLKNIPGVDTILRYERICRLLEKYGPELTKFVIRQCLSDIRSHNGTKNKEALENEIISLVTERIESLSSLKLKPVINATGILLHTNLGRSPLGSRTAEVVKKIMEGYCNLEFDLSTGKRSKRVDHVIDLIRYLTGAEDAVVVNNNAAAVLLISKIFAFRKEIIISRGELIEIGESFRMPDIITAGGAKMVEVGTTNRTNLRDYKKAITERTRIILKAHKSNYQIKGFTEEADLQSLAQLASENNLLSVYDIGSGLLRKGTDRFSGEPSVEESIRKGIDLVTFSCDKLLGGPQTGIIVGKKDLIRKIASHPVMRTYRVDKLILAALSSVLTLHLNEKERDSGLPLYSMLKQSSDELKARADKLSNELKNRNIDSRVIESTAWCGGGTLPGLELRSYSVSLSLISNKKDPAGNIYLKLLNGEVPVAAVLKKGEIFLDVMCIRDEDVARVVNSVERAL